MERASKSYVLVWISLIALAFASFGLSFVRSGRLALPIAFGIAVVKAVVVLLGFMHLRRATSSVRVAGFVCVALLVTLVTLMSADIATRAVPPLLPH